MKTLKTYSMATLLGTWGLALAPLAMAQNTGPTAAGSPPREIKTATGVAMVLIPAGEFTMGDPRGAEDTKPARKVKISQFYMDKHEVTQESFLALTGINTSKVQGDKNPVEQTSWVHAVRYCNARSQKEGLKPCYTPKTWVCDFAANGYRLPTEAEWEYACRAGTQTTYAFGDEVQKLPAYDWVKSNAGGTPHPVGTKLANAWGLFDMHGNVMEWCNDFYGPAYYKSGPAEDPTGPAAGELRVLRGGGWRSQPKACTSAFRSKDSPMNLDTCLGYPDYGFRCVRRGGD
ncbi:MAG TPA: formylglycine-generating enzyme family protein [Verrucomicrobiae bacterium]|nr:formylglycine-generating enzyme family protein [Verrucomicrobiae bacterium]